VWRAFNDVRLVLTAGYATVLQVAHPTVGAGVHDYSSFTEDPWGRLLRTLDYVHGTIYGGPKLAGEIGARVRRMHHSIKGTSLDGKRYSAMEPGAFAWVHATLAAGIVEGHRRFVRPFSLCEKEDFWAEWLRVGRLIGVRERDLPSDWAGFESYFAHMVAEELVWTPAVPEVLEMLSRPLAPELPGLPPSLWRIVRRPLAAQLRLATAGLMTPALRERLGVSVSATDQAAFRIACRALRAAHPLMPPPARRFGQSWVRYRRGALERGEVAALRPLLERDPAAAT